MSELEIDPATTALVVIDLQLRRRGIRTLIMTGIATNFGVESTARDAQERGYQSSLLRTRYRASRLNCIGFR